MPKHKPLSATFVKQTNKPGRYGDGRGSYGLSLLVKPTSNGRTSKTWSQRVRIHGRVCMVGLGEYPRVTLAEARQKCVDNRREVDRGRDPRVGVGVPTLAQATEQVIALNRHTWKTGSTERAWCSAFERFVYPTLGDRPVDQVIPGDLVAVMAGPWVNIPTTGRLLSLRLSQVFQWCEGMGLRRPGTDPTPAAVSTLPKHNGTTKHHDAIPHAELGEALGQVVAVGGPAALCVEFVAYTAVRSNEARGAVWEDIDGDTWTIPDTKNGRSHRVPLSPRALDVLERVRGLGVGGPVFPAPRGGMLSPVALRRAWQRVTNPNRGTIHGLRSSFRDWAAESGVSRELAESALGHVVPGVEGAYFRSDLLEQRRAVMEAWAAYLTR